MIDILFFPRCRVFRLVLVNSVNVEVRCRVVTKMFFLYFRENAKFYKNSPIFDENSKL
jgi:hypothetical protein